jgi:putative transposase
LRLTAGVCIIHLIRNTFRLTSRKYWDEIKRDLKPIYTAVNATAARAAFDDLAEKWGQRYPAVVRLWDNAWAEFIPFLDYGACRKSLPELGRQPVAVVRAGVDAELWMEVLRVGFVGSGSGSCAVDLHEVEGGGCQVEFAGCCVEAAAGEAGQDHFQVSDAGFDGGSSPLVEPRAFRGP